MFWRFWTAMTISRVGDSVTVVALPLVAVTVLHASSLQTSLITASTYAAWVLIGLPSGIIVSRLPLRATQVCMDVVRAAALLSVPVAAWTHSLTMTQIIVVAFVVSVATVIFDVGNSTFIVSIVSKASLTARNSVMSASESGTTLGGPAAGGLLVQLVGAATSLVVDVFSYCVSAILLAGLPRPPRTTHAPEEPVRDQVRAGLRFVFAHPVVRACALDAAAVNLFCGAQLAVTALFLVRTLHAPPGVVGLMVACEGIGGILGTVVVKRVQRRLGTARATLASTVLSVGFAVLMPLSFHGWGLLLYGIGNAGVYFGVMVSGIFALTHRQTVTPEHMLPRVVASVRFLTFGVIPIGAVLAGVVAEAMGVRTALWFACAALALSPVAIWASPIRRLRELTDWDNEETKSAPRPGVTASSDPAPPGR